MGKDIQVSVVGVSGYAGGELVRLLADHPRALVTFLGGKGSVGSTLAEVHPHLSSLPIAGERLQAIEPAAVAAASDLVFCALPAGSSSSVAPGLLEAGVRVVDLAGDFRIEPERYPEWYGFEHAAPGWANKAVYGLPELFDDDVGGAQLVANPGCFPTPVILGLSPLVAEGLVGPGTLRVDGKTGLSGAGRRARRRASPRARKASTRTGCRGISTRRRWNAGSSWRRGARPG